MRYVASDASDAEGLVAVLSDELQRLAEAPESDIETTLLIHPNVLGAFMDFNDFLGTAEETVAQLGFEGLIQVASFHPHYQFAGCAADDLGNATNRSPHPTLHLLRVASVARAVAAFPEAATIFDANIEAMQRLGAAGWAALQQQCREAAARATGSAGPLGAP